MHLAAAFALALASWRIQHNKSESSFALLGRFAFLSTLGSLSSGTSSILSKQIRHSQLDVSERDSQPAPLFLTIIFAPGTVSD